MICHLNIAAGQVLFCIESCHGAKYLVQRWLATKSIVTAQLIWNIECLLSHKWPRLLICLSSVLLIPSNLMLWVCHTLQCETQKYFKKKWNCNWAKKQAQSHWKKATSKKLWSLVDNILLSKQRTCPGMMASCDLAVHFSLLGILRPSCPYRLRRRKEVWCET